MLAEVLQEFGLMYVLAVVAAAILFVVALVLQWVIFGFPAWVLFAVVALLGVAGIIAKLFR